MRLLSIALVLIVCALQPAIAILPAPTGMHRCHFDDGHGSISFFRVPGAKSYRVYISYFSSTDSNDWKRVAEVSESESVSPDPNVARVEFRYKENRIVAVKVAAVDSSGHEGEKSAMVEHGWTDLYNTANTASSNYALLREPPADAPSTVLVYSAWSGLPKARVYQCDESVDLDLFTYSSRNAKTVRLTDHNKHPELRMGSVFTPSMNPRDLNDPMISPDGNWAFFRAYRTEKDGRILDDTSLCCLWAVNLNTRELRALTTDSYEVKDAVWSKDSRSVVFIKEVDRLYQDGCWGRTGVDLIRFDVDSGKQARLFFTPQDSYDVRMSPGKTDDTVVLWTKAGWYSISISGDRVDKVNYADIPHQPDEQPVVSPDGNWKVEKGALMRRTAAADKPGSEGWEDVDRGPVLSCMSWKRFTSNSKWLTGVIYESDMYNLTEINTATGPFRRKTLIQPVAVSLTDNRVVFLSPPIEGSRYFDYCTF